MFVAEFGANDKFIGKAGNDFANGMDGNDILKGGKGSDILIGYTGNDKLYGDAGSDFLFGGTDRDLLWGGKGTDYFLFYVDSTFGQGSDIDIIKDFKAKGAEKDMIAFVAGPASSEDITSYDDIVDRMSQKGKDVHITFDTGDTLIIENTKIKDLSAGNFAFQYEVDF